MAISFVHTKNRLITALVKNIADKTKGNAQFRRHNDASPSANIAKC